ncbi:putative T7SS-secreted protein [Streptomyces sp. NPDC051105]|uniref:putative T7SS-secreted protein n=1 Tax=Streptomyces sp. NPDC051105 TaxID=3154843 RepID=UPI003432A70E
MVRPADWHNLDLHDDPTPGDPHEVKLQGQRYKTFVEDVATVLSGIRSASKDSVLKESAGKAMDAFKDQIGKLPGQLQKLHDSYEMVSGALLTYAGKLEHAQTTADHALAKARTLRGDLSRAQSRLASATTTANNAKSAQDKLNNPTGNAAAPDPEKVRKATRDAQHANQHQKAAQGQVDSLNAQLAELRTKAENAGKDQDKAAAKLVHDIHSASDTGIHNKKWYEKVGDWIAGNWDNFVTACKFFVAVAGILLLFFGGPIFALIVLAAALIVLADTIAKFAQGKAGWGDVLFAVLDCIPVVGKLAMLAKAGRLVKGISMAIKVRKAEVACARLIKLWHMGEDLKGFRKVGFAFAKGEFKNTLKDALNGGWGDVKKNALGNLVSNAIGVSTGSLVSKGFNKMGKVIYESSLTNMTRRQYQALGMNLAGKTPMGKAVVGATQGFLTSVTKATVNSAFFGAKFDTSGVLLDTVSGYGDSGVGYKPGILSARAAFSR